MYFSILLCVTGITYGAFNYYYGFLVLRPSFNFWLQGGNVYRTVFSTKLQKKQWTRAGESDCLEPVQGFK